MQNNESMTSRGDAPAAMPPEETGFYRAFEDKFRGSRELILSRLGAYLPFIEPLKRIFPVAPAVDLGCGRGEWLQLLTEHGFEAQGVDLDAGMLQACQRMGLHAVLGNAIEFLKQLPSESQVIVSGFHLVEHISFADLQALVEEALRVLKPAGLLILETPNPENVLVSSVGFYMDPSHRSPLPPDLLAFVPEYYGYARSKIVRLQENPALVHAENISVEQVFGGASPDYAVVAQKAAAASDLETFNAVFEKEYGLSTSTLLRRYEQSRARQIAEDEEFRVEEEKLHAQNSHRIAELETTAFLQEKAGQSKESVLRIHLERMDSRLEDIHTAMEHVHERLRFADNVHAALLDTLHREREAQARLRQMLNSRSWRMTKGLRFAARALRAVVRRGPTAGAGLNKTVAIRMLVAATNRPVLRRIGGMLLSVTPGLKARLIRTVVNNAQPSKVVPTPSSSTSEGVAHLPARARAIRSMLDSGMKSP